MKRNAIRLDRGWGANNSRRSLNLGFYGTEIRASSTRTEPFRFGIRRNTQFFFYIHVGHKLDRHKVMTRSADQPSRK